MLRVGGVRRYFLWRPVNHSVCGYVDIHRLTRLHLRHRPSQCFQQCSPTAAVKIALLAGSESLVRERHASALVRHARKLHRDARVACRLALPREYEAHGPFDDEVFAHMHDLLASTFHHDTEPAAYDRIG